LSRQPRLLRYFAVCRGKGVIPRTVTLALLVGALLALAWGLFPVEGTQAGAVPKDASGSAQAVSAEPSFTGGGPAAMPPDSGRIAVKLAPGYRLQTGFDGALLVVRERELVAAGAVDVPGVSLERTGEVRGLGVQVVEAGAAVGGGKAAMEAAAEELQLSPGVLWAEVSHPVYACLVPDDPLYQSSVWEPLGQWGLARVGLPAAWDLATGSADVTIAVIDSGLNRDILEFPDRIVEPYSVLSGSSVWPAWQDTYGHGSGVAAVAAAQGNDHLGIAGAAWNIKVMPVKIANSNSSDDLTLATGMMYAVDNGADVINVSFAGAEPSATLEAAVGYALARGVVVVAAAGNSGLSSVGYPAGIPGVIAVGATDTANNRADFSNQGSGLDIVAPGVRILSYTSGGPTSFAVWSGTSFSAPLVAGVAALLKSIDPDLTPAQVTDILTESADDLGAGGWDQVFGWGLLDADEAVGEVASSVTTTTTTIPPTTTTTAPPSTTTTTAPPSTTTTTAPRFVDVNGSTPYSDEIEYMAVAGVVNGMGDGYFHPLDAVKRQQFAKMIVLALPLPVSLNDVCTFTDVIRKPGELYPYHYVAVAYNNGITQGTDPPRFFSPYGDLSRAQMITMVVRAIGLPDPDSEYVPPFANFSAVHYPFARKAASVGLLDALIGMGPDYDFLAPATRGEVCAILAPLLQ